MRLETLTYNELQALAASSKQILEEAFADGMPYEEVNLRHREFKLLQDALNTRRPGGEENSRAVE